jgi:hypothetical protein
MKHPQPASASAAPATAMYGINQHAPSINLNTPTKPTLTSLPRDETLSDNPVTAAFQQRHIYTRRFDAYVDSLVPYVTERYIALGGLILIFLLRILLAQGYYIVCYAHAIYLLNIFLAFLTPKFDPSNEEHSSGLDNEGGIHGLSSDTKSGLASFLPGSKRPSSEANGLLGGAGSDEFKPFIRRLPEFQFWYSILFRPDYFRSSRLGVWTEGGIQVCVYASHGLRRDGVLHPIFRHPGVLADPADVFLRAFLHHDATTNQAHDQVQVHAIRYRVKTFRFPPPKQLDSFLPFELTL